MAFTELDEFFDDTITLPIGGKPYIIDGVSGEDGLWAQRLVDAIERAKKEEDVDVGKLDDGDERLLYQRMLGDTFDEMLSDKVKWAKIGHAAMTVFFWTTQNKTVAEQYWQAGGDPEALGSAEPTPNRASRRASAAAARSTRSPAPTNGTRARSTSAAKKPASRSKKS
ncbi:DUF7426 family protein [Actinomadura rubrisoli]|uniref:DUF7426 domain-containing protein n=1 Tax=Actinomadura rubrisoli TaxID=2530368 RepID=A0A4R5C202_9ACTN|nr:hypothetical protein [Actinomadura rubrisoli]TDD90772.1 hypothetical protein E1298_12790 [Actinomadura rubrisoli]